MSLSPGETVRKDPSAKLSYTFDWSDWLTTGATITTSTFTISGPDAVLTKDNVSIAGNGLSASVRLLAGTLGKTYTVTHSIVTTGESPAQEDERSIRVKIVNQ